MGKTSKIFSSGTTGPISKKFDVNDPWVVASQNIVFYWLISIRGRIRPRPLSHRVTMGKTSKIFSSGTTGPISKKFDVNDPWVVASQNIVFYWLISIRGRIRPRPLSHRVTMGKTSKIFSSGTTGPISKKFDVNDPWVVASQNIVFYWLISIRGRIRPRPLSHRVTMGKTSKIFSSGTTGPISKKFDVNDPWVVASQNIVFYWLISIRGRIRPRPLSHRVTMGKTSKIFSSGTTGPISKKFDVNDPWVVASQNIVFYWLISIRGRIRPRPLSHRVTMGKTSKIFSSGTTGPISKKFDVNDPWVVASQNIVFYWLISIRGRIRPRPLSHRVTMGKTSKIFSSETTGPISKKFDVNDPWVVASQNIVFYWLISTRAKLGPAPFSIDILWGKFILFSRATSGPFGPLVK